MKRIELHIIPILAAIILAISVISAHATSILKTECIHRIKLQTYEEASLIIAEYIHFYNHERI